MRKLSPQLTFDDARKPSGRGGWRPGAGKPRGRTKVAHERRANFSRSQPLHVTLRVAPGVQSLRKEGTVEIVRKAIARAREDFRVVHFNVLGNHVHFIVEAGRREILARRMQGLIVSLARRINVQLGRRGKLFAERYHARVLRTPREVRAAIRYVLLNARHHAAERGEKLSSGWVDPFSSAPWFDGWRDPMRADQPWLRRLVAQPPPVAPPRSWLLTIGWRKGGLLAFDDVPGAKPS
jgi:REP element-mobilizing transposase RayT